MTSLATTHDTRALHAAVQLVAKRILNHLLESTQSSPCEDLKPYAPEIAVVTLVLVVVVGDDDGDDDVNALGEVSPASTSWEVRVQSRNLAALVDVPNA